MKNITVTLPINEYNFLLDIQKRYQEENERLNAEVFELKKRLPYLYKVSYPLFPFEYRELCYHHIDIEELSAKEIEGGLKKVIEHNNYFLTSVQVLIDELKEKRLEHDKNLAYLDEKTTKLEGLLEKVYKFPEWFLNLIKR